VGQKITYIYDFGDDWQHTIEVVKLNTGVAELKSILCTGGQRACPPEDCGSYPGYMEPSRNYSYQLTSATLN